jgi:hypothetical protein
LLDILADQAEQFGAELDNVVAELYDFAFVCRAGVGLAVLCHHS